MFRATSLEKIANPLAPVPTVPNSRDIPYASELATRRSDGRVVPTRPTPAYRVHYRNALWGGQRYIQASVYQIMWYGDRLILSAHRPIARAAYHVAHRAIRAFERHGTVNYTGGRASVRER